MARGDEFSVVYVDGDVPQRPIQLGQLLVDSSGIVPGTTNLQQCTSQDPLVYEPIQGGFPISPAEDAAGVTVVNDLYYYGDVRRYGAVSDGITDDTAAVHHAIEAGYDLIFPRGVTLVPDLDDTVIAQSVRMRGEGGAIIDGAGTGFFNFRNPAGTIEEISATGLEFRNFGGHVIRCLDGADLSAVLAAGGFTTIKRFTFVGNYVHDCNSGVYLGCKVKQCLVSQNRFVDLVAATTGCYGIYVGGNFFPVQTFLDANVNTGADRITIADHVFSSGQQVRVDNYGGALPGGLSASSTYYAKSIDANTLELYSDSGLSSIVDITSAAGGGTHFLRAADEDSISDLEDCVIAGNFFDGLDAQTASTECHAIIVYGKCASISDNQVRNVVNSGNGAAAEGIYTKVRFGSITGNHLEDAGTGEGYILVKGDWRNYVSQFAPNQSPPGWGVKVSNNTLRQKDTSANHTGTFIAASEVQVHHNHFEDMRGSAIETQNGLPYENIELSHNVLKRHRGQRGFYIRHFGSGFKCNDNTIHEFIARGDLSDVSMIEALGTANQGNWTDWEFCRNSLRDEGTCEATTRLRCLNIVPNTSNTATHLQVIGNSCQNQQSSIAELGINLSTGTYTNLIVKDNDCLLVDGSGTQFNNSGTISSAQFEGNRFTTRFITGTVNIEEWHCNGVVTNSGAGASARTHVLPVAVVGQRFTFVREDAGTFAVDPDGTERIVGTTGAGATVSLNNIGSSLTVECRTAGFWVATAAYDVTFN